MKLIHLSDLHIGKRVNEFSMLEDQKYILLKIIGIIDEEKPDGVIIAGDIFDKSVPGEDAVKLWGEFLTRLAERKLQVFAISGNHDSAIRVSNYSDLIDTTGIHISPAYDGNIKPYKLYDEAGALNIYMLPFVKPVVVRKLFEGEKIENYSDACRVAISQMDIDKSERNVLVAHQFVAGASTTDSEEHVVGGVENVAVDVFDDFNYVALGHIHRPQKVGRPEVRYCGTPLKYSFSEKDDKKSVSVVNIDGQGKVAIKEIYLTPKHDLREVRGSFEFVSNKANYEGTSLEDYVHIVLTDEEEIPEAVGKLRSIYKNIMKLTYDNKRTRNKHNLDLTNDLNELSQIEIFSDFYELMNNQPMSDLQREFTEKLINDIWEV